MIFMFLIVFIVCFRLVVEGVKLWLDFVKISVVIKNVFDDVCV